MIEIDRLDPSDTAYLAVDDLPIGGAIDWADVTGAVEGAQDAVGAMVADTATIDLTYTDATPELKADVKAASITEAMQVLADNTTQDVTTSKHGYVPKAPNDTAKFLRGDATWDTPAGGGGGLFGDGNDGDATITGGTTTLTRDMYYDNLTVASTGVLACDGFKVYVKTKLTIAAGGVISHNGSVGQDAAGIVSGPGGEGAKSGEEAVGGSRGGPGGIPGASAGTANGAGGNGGVFQLGVNTIVGRPSILGGGAGGGGGGSHSAATPGAGSNGWPGLIGNTVSAGSAGTGGAGGAGTGTASLRYAGGAGGGGGGVVQLWVNEIDNAGEIQAKGGNGGNGLTNGTTTKSGNGGGGGGGTVLVYYRTTSGSGLGTLTAAGGGPGTTGNGGSSGTAGRATSYQI